MVKKAVIAVVALILAACVVTGIVRGQIPIYAGVLLACVILAGCALFLMQGRVPSEPAAEPAENVVCPEPDTVQSAEQQLAERYLNMLHQLEIPDHARPVCIPSRLFAPHTVNLMCHCWKTQSHLCFFPRWDSIESVSNLLGYLQTWPEHVPDPLPFLISLRRIDYYDLYQPDGDEAYVILRYRNILEDSSGMILEESALDVLRTYLPDLERSVQSARSYPGSARQIEDIKVSMQQLKALFVQSLIDEEEYSAKKAELLTKL